METRVCRGREHNRSRVGHTRGPSHWQIQDSSQRVIHILDSAFTFYDSCCIFFFKLWNLKWKLIALLWHVMHNLSPIISLICSKSMYVYTQNIIRRVIIVVPWQNEHKNIDTAWPSYCLSRNTTFSVTLLRNDVTCKICVQCDMKYVSERHLLKDCTWYV